MANWTSEEIQKVRNRMSLQDKQRCAVCGRELPDTHEENCICQSILTTTEAEPTMECLIFDTEITPGHMHFRCDVCDIAYNRNEIFYSWEATCTYTKGKEMFTVCNMCAEEILGVTTNDNV